MEGVRAGRQPPEAPSAGELLTWSGVMGIREKGPKALDIDWEKLLEEDEEEDDIGKEGWDERLKAAMQYTGADRSVEIQEAIDEQDDDDDESA
eukprot:1311319-Rhodomonas_salina.2